MNCFYEQFQTKDYNQIEKFFNILSKIFIVLAILAIVLFNIVGTLTFILLYLAIFLLSRKFIVEYEYELTGNELSVNKIMNKKERKEILAFNIRDISSVKSLENISSKTKVIKAYLKESGINAMVYMVKTSEGVTGIQLAIDENLLSLIKRVNPLAFY